MPTVIYLDAQSLPTLCHLHFCYTNCNVLESPDAELLSAGLRPRDMNLLAIGASAFGGKWGAQALGSSLSLTFNRGFYTNNLNQSVLNFGIGRENRGIHSMSSKLSNQWMFNSGFGKAFLPSFSIGVQSGLKTIPNEK